VRPSLWIGIALPVIGFGVGMAIFLSGAPTEPQAAGAGAEATLAAGAEPDRAAAGAGDGSSDGTGQPESEPGESAELAPGEGESADASLQRELSEPERLEAAAYPWEEFEAILGRSLTGAEKATMRDLRKEHGLRLAETRARVDRGEMSRADFDAWRAARASEFRADLERTLGCTSDQVLALLEVPMGSPAQ
jgi:hypothetical protein